LKHEVITMYTTIQKWGNSHAVRIPKALLEKANLTNNDQVKIKVLDGNIVITPVKKHRTLKERIAGYDGNCNCRELDTGNPRGNEAW
jgi:antitoxin MazE